MKHLRRARRRHRVCHGHVCMYPSFCTALFKDLWKAPWTLLSKVFNRCMLTSEFGQKSLYGPMWELLLCVSTGCGSGTVCSTSQSDTAFCDQCNFDRKRNQCTSFSPLLSAQKLNTSAGSLPIDSPTKNSTDQICLSDPVKVYSGNALSFNGTNTNPCCS